MGEPSAVHYGVLWPQQRTRTGSSVPNFATLNLL